MNCLDHFESSLTKGCFVHKPSKSKKKKNTKLQGSNNNWLKEFKHSWNEIEMKIQEIENSSYEKTFDAVAKFVDASIQSPLEHMDEIPAAVLQMGVNMPDHNNILKCLEKTLRSKKSYTALLEPRKCHNFSSIVQCLDNMLQNQMCEVKSSSKKQARSARNGHIKPLVLIIQDVETFDLELLEELILNCKIYIGKLPIVLIFGMSSAMVTLQNILPQRVLCHLGIETFYSFAAAEYLTRIIEEVVVSPQYPFKLGPKVFRLVVDTVLYHDFSVTNLKHLLHFSLLKHFYKNKGAVLLCSELDVERKITNLKNEELQHLRKLPSLQQYRENNPDITTDFNSASDFKLLLTVLMENIFTFQNSVIISLKVLHYLTKELPGSPLGKQFREIYLLNLEKQLYSSACFKEAEKLLKFQSHNELLSKLKVCLDFLKSSDQSLAEDLMSVIETSIRRLTELTSEDFDKKLNTFSIENEKFSSRFELQEKMRSNIKLRRSKFEAVRNEVIDNILSHYKNIHSPTLLPLHEIFFFDEAYSCKKHLMPSPRVVLCSALTNPHHYLECKCCKIVESAGGEIPSSMPDLSALYKLHLECGKLINLCDWLEAFKSTKSKEFELKKKGTSKVKADESKLNIRFLHSATELQLLGFVKPTKRKTDHVARLTFGTF